jgi:hypothetical protein
MGDEKKGGFEMVLVSEPQIDRDMEKSTKTGTEKIILSKKIETTLFPVPDMLKGKHFIQPRGRNIIYLEFFR